MKFGDRIEQEIYFVHAIILRIFTFSETTVSININSKDVLKKKNVYAFEDIIETIFASDNVVVKIYGQNKYLGRIHFLFGADPKKCINNYTDNIFINGIIDRATTFVF